MPDMLIIPDEEFDREPEDGMHTRASQQQHGEGLYASQQHGQGVYEGKHVPPMREIHAGSESESAVGGQISG